MVEFTARERLKLLAGAGALVLPACGGGGGSQTVSSTIAPPAPAPIAPPPEPTPPPPEPTPPMAAAAAPVEGLLRDTFRNNFEVGFALSSFQAQDQMDIARNLGLSQFSAMTPEFEMQMSQIAPQEGVFNFDNIDRIVDFGLENNLPMRGHSLLWHEQTPEYFLQGSRDDIRQRLDTYIGTVVEHFRDRINVWDVVNEVVSTDLFRGDAGIGPDRMTIWFDAVGNADYIDWAFEAARRADPNARLFINDFNTEEPRKLGWLIDIIRRLRARGVPIDGVGHQTHIRLETTPESVLASIDAVNNEFLGLVTHITEMDISMYTDPGACFETGTNCLPDLGLNPPAANLARQAEQYRALMNGFAQRSFVESVTFWGVFDGSSFLNNNPAVRFDHPLLFDREGNPKPAFLAITDSNFVIE